ncbi:MAG: type I DNA topoisomerase [Candidatus Nomurabacteria bacterium]|nr:type I DNA topoisomerase [Candidatus Nomurabacteria bacterium]
MAQKQKNLVIVESPAKAKTIEKYLGSDFRVLSSVGHIRAIADDKSSPNGKAIDPARGFATTYVIDPDKQKTVSELKKAAKDSDLVWLATDEDREGEGIAWHLCEVLGLPEKTTNRIVFHEITKPAIEAAIENPRKVDMKMVEAQQARQILDRLVGFELSPVVWRKVPGGKSAGRVQSPAVRLLVEREREIQKFDSKFEFKVSAIFTHAGKEIKATLDHSFPTEAAAKKFLESLIDAKFTVADVSKTPAKRTPPAPFTTSTLQQVANSRIGLSARATMTAAQRLYQSGKITYMRTDSLNLSGQFLSAATKFITQEFGEKYHQIRTFKTKSAGAQEAHEAIRPTNVTTETAGHSETEKKLYKLIRARTLATQMANAEIEKTVVKITTDSGATFEATGEVVLFDGFLKVYGERKDEVLPSLSVGDKLVGREITARQNFDRPPARYTEGSLVKELEKRGIGRPSTYATILSTIQTRGYAERGLNEGTEREAIELKLRSGKIARSIITEKTGADKGKLVPTDIGMTISDFLTDYFKQVVDYDFTAEVEKELDDIADSKLERNKMLSDFYGPFHKLVEKSDSIKREKVAEMRKLGTDPKTKLPVFARIARFGGVVQLGDGDGDDKPRFAPLPDGARIDTVTLEQALTMLQLPRLVGKTDDDQEITANIGRFGPYIKVGSLFISIKPPLTPFDIDEKTARQLYAEKLAFEKAKNIADFGDIKVLNGRFGPYVTDGKKNAKIPKDTDPKKLTEAAARKLLSEAPAKKSARRGRQAKR